GHAPVQQFAGERYYSPGSPNEIIDKLSGNTLTVQQPSQGVTKITNSAGKWIQLTKNASNRVTQVIDPAGNAWTYEYNAAGMLTKVTSPGAAPAVRQYHYENTTAANAATLLTGISINSARYSRYTYNTDGTVQQSALEGGAEVDNFVYGAGQTTVTNAKGMATTYAFTSILGEKKITSVVRAGTSSCASAAAQTVYDSRGYVDYTLDWKGNKTDYTYDAAGKLLQVVAAVGTSAAAGITYKWSGEDVVQLEYRNASDITYRRVDYTYANTVRGAVRNVAKGVDMLDSGAYRDARGYI
ncbi:hypothetical protein, partial [Massilia sp. TSP1-1-2]|uniref:hypothetical protein n=1 Tax=Massilia sp. TSP1-1-2 TaxID=2804649 RepID=UPI003CF77538